MWSPPGRCRAALRRPVRAAARPSRRDSRGRAARTGWSLRRCRRRHAAPTSLPRVRAVRARRLDPRRAARWPPAWPPTPPQRTRARTRRPRRAATPRAESSPHLGLARTGPTPWRPTRYPDGRSPRRGPAHPLRVESPQASRPRFASGRAPRRSRSTSARSRAPGLEPLRAPGSVTSHRYRSGRDPAPCPARPVRRGSRRWSVERVMGPRARPGGAAGEGPRACPRS